MDKNEKLNISAENGWIVKVMTLVKKGIGLDTFCDEALNRAARNGHFEIKYFQVLHFC